MPLPPGIRVAKKTNLLGLTVRHINYVSKKKHFGLNLIELAELMIIANFLNVEEILKI